MIRKWRNQKEIPSPKSKAGKQIRANIKKKYRKPSKQLFPNRLPHSNLTMKTHIWCKQHKNRHQNTKIKPQQKYRIAIVSFLNQWVGGLLVNLQDCTFPVDAEKCQLNARCASQKVLCRVEEFVYREIMEQGSS